MTNYEHDLFGDFDDVEMIDPPKFRRSHVQLFTPLGWWVILAIWAGVAVAIVAVKVWG